MLLRQAPIHLFTTLSIGLSWNQESDLSCFSLKFDIDSLTREVQKRQSRFKNRGCNKGAYLSLVLPGGFVYYVILSGMGGNG